MSAARTIKWWMDDRRGELGLTWDEVAKSSGVSTETLYRVGDGRPMRTTTKKGIERALRWESGSIEAILDGDGPTPIPEIDRPPEVNPYQELYEMADALQAQAEEFKKRLDGLSHGGEPRKTG